MKLIIDISDEQWQAVKDGTWCGSVEIANGTPLQSGRWLHMSIHDWQCDCSECGADSEEPYPYCPYCGARMESEVEDADSD